MTVQTYLRDTRFRKIISDLWSNKTRTLLVVLSIAVGVFAVGMTTISREMMLRDLNGGFAKTNPADAWMWVSPFDEDLTDAVEGLREVRTAAARREAWGDLEGNPDYEDASLLITVYPDFDDIKLNKIRSVSGMSEPPLRQVLVERYTADKLGVGLGDQVTVRLREEDTYTLTIAGIVHDLAVVPYPFSSELHFYSTMETLQWMGEEPYYNRMDVQMAYPPETSGATYDVVLDIRDRVIEPAGYELQGSWAFEPGEHWANSETEAITLVLSVLGILCIILSAGLVINTITAILTQQVRQIGIMRSVGAPRPQVTQMYIISVLMFGTLALFVAVPLGLAGAYGMTYWVASLLNFDITGVVLTPIIVATLIGIGLLVPILAALWPILAGTRITVHDAIYQEGIEAKQKKDGFIDKALEKLRGLPRPVMLSLRNTFRRKARLAFTLATLTLAGAIFIGVFSTRASLIGILHKMSGYWMFDVTMGVGGDTTIYEAEREAMRVPGVAYVESWGRGDAIMILGDGTESEEIAIYATPANSFMVEPILMEGRWLTPEDTRQIVIDTDFLVLLPDVGVGDEITLKINDVNRPFEVVGLVTGRLNDAGLYMNYDYFSKLNNTVGRASTIRVRASQSGLSTPEQQAQMARALEERFDNANISRGGTTTNAQIISETASQFDIIVSFLLVMAVLLAVVGALGLAGTMSLNVLERTKEIGVMRAIGASNASLRGVVLVEGVMIGFLSWFFGAVASVPLGVVLANAIGEAFLGIKLDYIYSIPGLLIWLALVVIISGIASLAPANKASRLSVREVLAYE